MVEYFSVSSNTFRAKKGEAISPRSFKTAKEPGEKYRLEPHFGKRKFFDDMDEGRRQLTEEEKAAFSRSREASDEELLREGAEEVIDPETGEKTLLATPEQKRIIDVTHKPSLFELGSLLKVARYHEAAMKMKERLEEDVEGRPESEELQSVLRNLSEVLKGYGKESWAQGGNGEVYKLAGSPGLEGLALGDLAFVAADPREDMQPLGVQVMSEAHQRGIPSFMISGHHAKGEYGVGALTKQLHRDGLASGNIPYHEGRESSERDSKNPNAFLGVDVAVASKYRPHNWERAFRRMFEKTGKKSGRYLIIEDNLDKVPEGERNSIHQSLDHARNSKEFEGLEIEFAKDLTEAREKLESGHFDGVITDCYFPETTGSMKKDLGNQISINILKKQLGDEKASTVLARAQEIEREFDSEVQSLYEQLVRVENEEPKKSS